jgi:hypothetical protein
VESLGVIIEGSVGVIVAEVDEEVVCALEVRVENVVGVADRVLRDVGWTRGCCRFRTDHV